MTGVLNAMVGGHSSAHTLTVGTALSEYGLRGGFGSISPTTFRGRTIIELVSANNAPNFFDLALTVDGTEAQVPAHFFSSISVVDYTGARRTYTAASASYEHQGDPGASIWIWGDGSNTVWRAGDVGLGRSVVFNY